MISKIKKAVIVGISIMCLFNTQIVMAEEKEEETLVQQVSTMEDDENYIEITRHLVQRGRDVLANWRHRGYTVSISGIVRLEQSNPAWSNVEMEDDMGNKATIGSQGCALTCFTMVKNFLDKTSMTPADINTILRTSAFPFNWVDAASNFGFHFVLRLHQNWNDLTPIDTQTANLAVIGAIDEYSRPAIIGMAKYSNSGDTHFVVGYGYTSDGDIIIYDPASQNNTLLSQYMNDGTRYIYRVFVYTK